MALNNLCPLIHLMNLDWSVWPIIYGRCDGVSLPRQGHKRMLRLPACPVSFWITCSLGRQLPCYLWRGPPGKKLRPAANTVGVSHFISGSSSPSQAIRYCSPGWHVNCNLSDPAETRTTQPSHFLLPDSQKVCDIINISCVKRLNFSIFCYIPVDS